MARSRLSRKKGKVIIGYKKVWVKNRISTAIVTLRIAANTRRTQPYNYKCRAACAKVLEIRSASGRKLQHGYSHFINTFRYTVGETVRPNGKRFEPNLRQECASGIHFFLTREEANGYTFV